ncbi:MAG: leucine--tRNA ligase [Ilumatobacteraceae bacterium]|nr:leucine--tRNA ligase [Ilumatobacteraceae bacterium]
MTSSRPSDSASSIPAYRYTAALAAGIEQRWQNYWQENHTFDAPNPAGPLADPVGVANRSKLFVLDMFPYPSGTGLHVGHPLGYIGTDVYARFKRMQGYNVLHAFGYDSFGLPAEQHAISTGVHPRVNTNANISNMRRQLRRLGLGHDERRSICTTDEEFYKWTQWIFLQIYNAWFDPSISRARHINELIAQFASGKRNTSSGQAWNTMTPAQKSLEIDEFRLAYLSDAPVNWCPGLGTILANEEVTAEGRSDIGNYPVFRRNMRQWTMRISVFSDRLLGDLDRLDWPEPIKLMQRNWIGRSEGARVAFSSSAGAINVFTTRPDTLFGATFIVLSPEHPLVETLCTAEQREHITAYIAQASATTDTDRQDDSRKKTGIFTGSYAINPVTNQPIPIWIADYVLMGYGTGAIMAVPSGDQRDFEFARQFDLQITATQMPTGAWFDQHHFPPSDDCATWPSAFVGEGNYVHSANDTLSLNGQRSIADAKNLMNAWLTERNLGEATVTYRLRDWLFSRQRYWGEPFPIVYDQDGLAHDVPESMLPVLLPELTDFSPQTLDPMDSTSDPVPPLARVTDWVTTTLDLGDGPRTYRREVNVMPQWAGSCWYELRYLDPTNTQRFVDPEVEKYWMGPATDEHTGGVDLYVGGVEHAVLHLLYARFWHKVLHDLGHVSSEEPFHRLFNQGYIQAYAYRDDRGQTVPAEEVTETNGSYTYGNEKVTREYGKMGKSLKNIVTPDEMYDEYGADTFRLYEMAMGPLEASRPWNTLDVVGMQRFLQRLWRNVVDEETGALAVSEDAIPETLLRQLHKCIAGVAADMETLRFNTAISKLIELNNDLTQYVNSGHRTPLSLITPMAQMLSPLCPHLAEEIWALLGHSTSITFEPFPVADPNLLASDTIEIPVQVNGKVRSRIVVLVGASQDDLLAAALSDDKVIAALGGVVPARSIAVVGRLVNFVL